MVSKSKTIVSNETLNLEMKNVYKTVKASTYICSLFGQFNIVALMYTACCQELDAPNFKIQSLAIRPPAVLYSLILILVGPNVQLFPEKN